MINRLYTEFIATQYYNEFDKYAAIARLFGCPLSEDSKVLNTDADIDFLIPNELKNKYIVIASAASEHVKNWPKDYLQTLCAKLSADQKIVLLGISAETTFDFNMKDENIINLVDKTELHELPAILKYSKLVIGLDSGLTHLAYYLDKPLVALTGGGGFYRFFPHDESNIKKYLYNKLDCFGCSWNCIYTESKCITGVELNTIIDTTKNIIDEID